MPYPTAEIEGTIGFVESCSPSGFALRRPQRNAVLKLRFILRRFPEFGPSLAINSFSILEDSGRYIRSVAVLTGRPTRGLIEMFMKRCLTGAIAALVLAAGLAAAPKSHARDRLSPGAAAAIGVLGGLAVGGAIAASAAPAYAAPAPVYVEPAPVYVAPPPPRRRVYVEHCYTERSSEYVPGWGWQPVRRRICE
jgi:hypothetical protein